MTSQQPMNASPHHSKVKLNLALSDPLYVAGGFITGKMEIECRADKGLGLGIIMVELFAIQELTSRDHSAMSTFLHSRRLFQGPGLPPSNAVFGHVAPGDPPLPPEHFQARRGLTTYMFRFPVPSSSPSAISFGSGLARVRFEVRASVAVAWKGDRRLVTTAREADVVESGGEDFGRIDPEGVVVGEHGKVWMQAKVVGGLVVAGESACVELQVKNHSSKKTSGLSLTLTRSLHIPGPPSSKALQISDTLAAVSFKGPEYIVPAGGEGVASLVFDVPRGARGVRGGPREGAEEEDGRTTDALFEVRCLLSIRLSMGMTSKDIAIDLPVTILHPAAAPLPVEEYPTSPSAYPYPAPGAVMSPGPMSPPVPPMSPQRVQSPYLPSSPPPLQPWLAAAPGSPAPYQYISPPIHGQQYYFPPPPMPVYTPPPSATLLAQGRASSTAPRSSASPPRALPTPGPATPPPAVRAEPEEGKGVLASRVSHHLRMSSRNRSVSPRSHRFPIPGTAPAEAPEPQVGPSPTGVAIATQGQMQSTTSSPLRKSRLVPPGTLTMPARSPTSEGVVHSPRPMLSPKHSFSVDPQTHASIPKSDRVEELERMADEVVHKTVNLSHDIPKDAAEKTLPSPPVPSAKDKGKAKGGLSATAAARPRAENLFANLAKSEDVLPTTPTAAITPVKFRGGTLGVPGQGRSESGLDALERRLLAEVGTRKVEKSDRLPDARAVVSPINIPSSRVPDEPLNDSAISSLTLANHELETKRVAEASADFDHDEHERERDRDSDERTHLPGKASVSGDDRDTASRGRTERKHKHKEGKKEGKKKERIRDEEAIKMRQAAKGRVAEWLGAIHTDVPPPTSPSPVSATDEPSISNIAGLPDAQPQRIGTKPPEENGVEKNSTAAPNPRSSGFVPIATLRERKDDAAGRSTMRLPDPATLQHSRFTRGNPAQADLVIPVPAPIAAVKPPVKVNGAAPKAAAPSGKLEPPFARRNAQSPARLPTYPPPPLDPEVKYDIRSARGGRGGKVTAVASLWAAQAEGTSGAPVKNGTPVKPAGTFSPLANGRSSRPTPKSPLAGGALDRPTSKPVTERGMPIKSPSLPAMLSSSMAAPMISTTASLARVERPKHLASPIKVPPTIAETSNVPASARPKASSPPPASTGTLAFGQARLRDLIKKYQGQTS